MNRKYLLVIFVVLATLLFFPVSKAASNVADRITSVLVTNTTEAPVPVDVTNTVFDVNVKSIPSTAAVNNNWEYKQHCNDGWATEVDIQSQYNVLGLGGWELVSVQTMPVLQAGQYKTCAFFKRPLAE